MLMNQCNICGGVLRRQTNHTMVCTCCSAVFPEEHVTAQEPAVFRRQETLNPDLRQERSVVITLLIIATVFTFAIGLFPVSIGLIVTLVKVINSNKPSTVTEAQRMQPKMVRKVEQTEKLVTCDDYLSAFYRLHMNNMPLGRLGAEAVRQIQQLIHKQEALRAMLEPGHPFLESGNNAQGFILDNCRHILFRMKYCDQNERVFLSEHELYITQKLKENEKILRDFEKLIIEITQMDDNAPRLQPHMDVLADALRSIRTYDGALEDEPLQMPVQQPAPQTMHHACQLMRM